MGRFFKTSEYKTNSVMKDTISTFNDYISHNERYNYFDSYEIIINNFLDGKRAFERPFGYVQTDDKSLYKFPLRTGDLETDFKNITDYLENLDECFNELVNDETIFSSVKHSYQNHDHFKKENGKLIFNKKLLHDIYDRKLNFNQKENTIKIDSILKDSNSNLYDSFKIFKQTHVMREKREKPKWYEFSKRFRNWKEERSLNKLELMLKNKGVKADLIENAKSGITITEDTFNKSFGLNENNFTDSLNKSIAAFKKTVELNKNGYKEKNNILTFLNILDEYKNLEKVHESNINNKDQYQKEEALLKDSRINLAKLMHFNTEANKEIYNELFHNEFNSYNINILRENIYEVDDKTIDCYYKLISDIDDIAVDFNLKDNNSKLIVIDDELFESKKDEEKEELEEEIDLIEEKTNII